MNTSNEFGGPFESIDVITLKTFSEVQGDTEKNLATEFVLPKFENQFSREEQIKRKHENKEAKIKLGINVFF